MVEDHDDGRGGDRRSDDVVGRRRDAHAQDEGSDHRENEGQHEVAACRRYQDFSELEPQAGLGYDANDDAGAGAGRYDAEGSAGSRLESLDHIHEGEGCLPVQQDIDDGRTGPDGFNPDAGQLKRGAVAGGGRARRGDRAGAGA